MRLTLVNGGRIENTELLLNVYDQNKDGIIWRNDAHTLGHNVEICIVRGGHVPSIGIRALLYYPI